MLPFFRRIRNKLLLENKFTGYIFYALGEIILVVIGILIALQVNNWNTEKALDRKQKAFVRQLHSDLIQTDHELEELIQFFRERAKASQIVTFSFWRGIPLQDTAIYNFGRPTSNKRYNPTLGTARSLINSGNIDIIPSDSLRKSIIAYVDIADGYIRDIQRYEETYYRRGQEILSLELDTWHLYITYLEDKIRSDSILFKRDLNAVPADYKAPPFPITMEEVYSNPLILEAYEILLIAHRNTSSRYRDLQEETRKLIYLMEDKGY